MEAAVSGLHLSRPRSVGQAMRMLAVPLALSGAFGVLASISTGPDQPSRSAAENVAASDWSLPLVVDGKITDRHRDAHSDNDAVEGDAPGLVRPAALVMPMSADWPEHSFAEAELVRAVGQTRLVTAAQIAPVIRRPAAAVERQKVAALAPPLSLAPSSIAASLQVAEAATPASGPSLLSRAIVEPVTKVADIVSGAAGVVGAAGSWTVSRAAELLPRW
jgi:hypothetical protein